MNRIKRISLISLVLLVVMPAGAAYADGHSQLESTSGSLETQLEIALTHANKARDETTIDGIRHHLEHVINAIEGADGANYGDLNGDGKTEDFGDGVGVFGWANRLATQANSRGSSSDANVVAFAAAISDGASNVSAKAENARDIALEILKIDSVSLALIFVGPGGHTVVSELNAALKGSVVLGDGVLQSTASIEAFGEYLENPTPSVRAPVVGAPDMASLSRVVLLASIMIMVLGAVVVVRNRHVGA